MKSNRKEITILSLVIVFVLTILLSSSYAWFTVTAESNNTTTIKVGDLNLVFTDNNQDVDLLNKTPIPIDDAFEEDGYTFTLTNTGSIKSKYTVVLEDKELNDGESRLDNKYVRYILKSGNSTKIGFISDLTEGKLVEGILVKNGEVTYNLKLFLDEDVFDKDAAGKILKKEIKISAEQDNSDVSANKILTPMPRIVKVSGDGTAVGDVVRIEDEEFYVVGRGTETESGKVKLLTKYTIKDNVQNQNMIEHVAFINDTNCYWANNVGEGKKYPGNYYPNGNPYPYVYDENSKVYPKVENYVSKISNFGINNVTGRLLSYEENSVLPASINNTTINTAYWLGSAYDADNLWDSYSHRGVERIESGDVTQIYIDSSLIRPVILIPSYYLK